jgi:hypothetical protein
MTKEKNNGKASPLTDPRRKKSEEITLQAEAAWSNAEHDRARELFAVAAAIEESVAREAPISLPRARSAVAVAAVALWNRAGDFARAKRIAYAFLGQADGLSDQGREDLERLVDRCSREAELTRLTNDPTMVPVELKLDGGRIGIGVAPESVARRRREMLASLLRRTAELEAKVEYRDRGESELERNDQIQLLEVPALAASYGVRLYVATGAQQRISSEQMVTPARVVERFLVLAEAAAQGAAAVRAKIADPQYANAFLDGFGEIAPDGEDVGTVACFAPSWKVRARSLVFEPEHRRELRAAAAAPFLRDARPGERTFDGQLVGVHLTRASSWIELEIEGKNQPEIIMVNEKRLRAKVATMRSGDTDALIRVYAKRSARQQRMAMTDVVALTRSRSTSAS